MNKELIKKQIVEDNQFNNKKMLKKQDTVVHLARTAYPEMYPQYVHKKPILNQIDTQEQLEDVSKIIGFARYGIDNCYAHDVATGIYTGITRKDHEITNVDTKPDNYIFAEMSYSKFKKIMFYHFTDDTGKTMRGMGKLAENAIKSLSQMIAEKKEFPSCYVSIQRKSKDGKELYCKFYGQPIRISGIYLTKGGTISGVEVQLDKRWFPLNTKTLKTKDQFIYEVAGLTSFLSVGRDLYHKETDDPFSVDVKTARRLILMFQAGVALNSLPYVQQHTLDYNPSKDRHELILTSKGAAEIYPNAVMRQTEEGKPYIRYDKFIQYANTVGRYYRVALDYFNLDLSKKCDLYIPADDKAAYFDKQKKKLSLRYEKY